jgi:hypothetical protein
MVLFITKILVMKTNMKKTMLFGLLASAVLLFSFSSPKGGDSFEIFLNGNRLVQQFVHVDNSVKTLQVTSTSVNDKLDIYYSHCGRTGTSRNITVKDEKGKILKTWKFADASGKSAMTIMLKDLYSLEKNDQPKFSIVYSSRELPAGKSLATLNLGSSNVVRK